MNEGVPAREDMLDTVKRLDWLRGQRLVLGALRVGMIKSGGFRLTGAGSDVSRILAGTPLRISLICYWR